jgi:hypothetical protein
MAPLTAEERQKALAQPGASEVLLGEYERLVSEFFMFDPDMITLDDALARSNRLQALHEILFPGAELKLSPVKA